jgi:nucleoside-diphosphate-sugar epimerase
MQTVLVAGGAGFIGSNLCSSLLKDGYKVVCLDNLLTGDKKNIEELLKHDNFRFIEADLIKAKPDLEKIDMVYHLASPASPNAESDKSYLAFPIETLLVNSQGTQVLLDLCRENSARFLFASTSEIYGDPNVSPQSEDYNGNVSPNGPRSVYDEAKRFGEAMSMAYYRKFKLDIRIARIFNTYGPNMRKDDGRVVSNFIVQAIGSSPITVFGSGSQTRSFCYVDDMVRGLRDFMQSDKASGEVINLGNTDERRIDDLARLIKELTGSSSEIVFESIPEDDPKQRKPDIEKAKKILGWRPYVGLEVGLEKTVEYFRRIL